MRKLFTLLLAAVMLVSCTAPAVEKDVYYNLDHISMELPQGLVLTTLEKAADVNDYFRPDPEFTYILQQQICFADGLMYARPQYPSDVIHQGRESILTYLDEKKRTDYIEVYTTDDFSSYEKLALDLPGYYQFWNSAEKKG